MKSNLLGKNISKAEVQNISKHGIWLFINDEEFFLPLKEYPWFKKAKIEDIYNLKLVHNKHLYWSKLDIDLSIDSLRNPEKYPLTYRKS